GERAGGIRGRQHPGLLRPPAFRLGSHDGAAVRRRLRPGSAAMTGGAPGKVYLVGAGPGDPGLITVRGLELIRSADVLVYDRLIPAELLDEARPDAERHYVGRARGSQIMDQAALNALLVKLASEGKTVVRLKGGDPFVFGRGGEEAEACATAGVPFEIVPGVT